MGRHSKSVMAIFILLLLIGTPSLHAHWVWNGVAICTATGDQSKVQITSDSVGGAIITWIDNRNGNYDIYAQRVDANGTVQWAADGVAICTATENQSDPQIISDGTEGAIITWEDRRNGGEADIYAQRIDSSGVVHWITNGVAICTAIGFQYEPQIISDGAGGAIITWMEKRSGLCDIYAQRIDANGNVKWIEDGVVVDSASSQLAANWYLKIISDCSGGAIIMWLLHWVTLPCFDILASRIDANGNVLWWTFIALNEADSTCPQIISDGSGGAIITWVEMFIGIYAQKIDLDGFPWGDEGVAICEVTGDESGPRITSDRSGGAFIAWSDPRFESDDFCSIFAQKIDASGTVQWAEDGVAVCSTMCIQGDLQIISHVTGICAIITWEDYRNGNIDIYAQKLYKYGIVVPPWTSGGVAICTASMEQKNPKIISDGAMGAIITWEDYRNGNSDIYAMRVCEGVAPIATLLQSFHTSSNGVDITIEWILSEAGKDIQFFILRSEVTNGNFRELVTNKVIRKGLIFTFRDETCEPGITYRYRVEVSDEEDRRILFETDPITTPALPLNLYQNYPNPFNPGTRIEFDLPVAGKVCLEVFDVTGRIVKRLIVGKEMGPGRASVSWDGTSEGGNRVASGIYYYRLKAGKESRTRKMVVIQ